MARLPIPGSDENMWGTVLNDFLSQAHNTDGSIKDSAITGLAGKSVSSAAPADNDVLTYNSTSGEWEPAATGSASVPDATAGTKGILQLTGDLGGTAASPTVPGLAGKENLITAGTTAQYWRGDKSFQTLDKTAVGLANVDNTSDANKPVSSATQTALNLKADSSALTAHINDTTDAHAASAIGYTANAWQTATTVQAALEQAYPTKSIVWDSNSWAPFTHYTMTQDAGQVMTTTVVNGKGRVTNTAGSPNLLSNVRHWYADSTFPAIDSEITSLWWAEAGAFANGATVSQQGNIHRVQNSGGSTKGFIVWQDVTFGQPHIMNVGLWQADGTTLILGSTNTNFTATGVLKIVQVTAAVRATNTVTLTVPQGHGIVAGDSLGVDLTNNTFDGPAFAVSSVTPTTIVYPQVVTDASGATGTCYSINHIFPYWVKSRLIGNTLSVKMWKYGESESDWGDSTRAFSWTWTSGTVTAPTGTGLTGIFAGHMGNSHFAEFGQTTFTKLG